MRLLDWLNKKDPDFVYKLKDSDEIVVMKRCSEEEGSVSLYDFNRHRVNSFKEVKRLRLSDYEEYGDDCYYNIVTTEVEDENREEVKRFKRRFTKYHNAILKGKIEKAVTYRVFNDVIEDDSALNHLFVNAVCLNKSAEIIYKYNPKDDFGFVFLCASPELLLKKRNDSEFYESLALAGTMRLNEKVWSDKNKKEHQFVLDYFKEVGSLSFCSDLSYSNVYEKISGNIKHLTSDIKLKSTIGPVELAYFIHPTPAISGFPKEDAYKMISKSEDRELYGGYVTVKEKNGDFYSFVNLRCFSSYYDMDDLTDCGRRLFFYAGAGIVADSTYEEELEEVTAKYKSIKSIFYID